MESSIKDKKRAYVQAVYRIISEEGFEGVKIRRIAKDVGCTSAVLYKHFDNLDHLITLAAIKFLGGYIRRYQECVRRRNDNAIEYNLMMWKIFIDESFKNVPIYEKLFFGPYTDQLSDAFYEYYQLFPGEIYELDGYTTSILLNGDLEERELIILRLAANKGLITLEAAKLLSCVNVMIYHGFLKKYENSYQEEGVAEKAARECYHAISEITRKYLK
ncbi:MAG: TetR/AcrR family transcriptional regulator [Lachnospiraceae bacterium]|nr:TetR/AcrR family transcriptional regulator [Lachnospiraceae bacterium]